MTRVAIIGAGFGGIGAAIRLKQAGFHDVVILERAGDVGGVWRDNTYPGCACDVQSHLYSFSFAANPAWTRSYSRQQEIHAYLQRVADDFGVRPLVRFHHDVRSAAWRDGRWHIETSGGDVVADVLIGAQGALSDPIVPELPGLATFAGKTMHTARWDGAFDLAGKRVGVVGTGASAIQLVPAIQPVVATLTIFQRTPPWIVPRRDVPIGPRMRALFERLPFTQRVARTAIALQRDLLVFAFVHPRMERVVRAYARKHLKVSVPDRALRKRLTPSYAIGCKRILVSDDYLPALTQPNVELVTDAISRVDERGVVDATGRHHDVDVLIFGTGFHVTDPPIAKLVRGRDGRTLAETWNGSMRAHLGTSVHGFPNFFLMCGPNAGLGHSSVVVMMEAQLDHIVGALAHMRDRGVVALEPRREAQDAFVADVDRRMAGTVWTSGGCSSWYLDETGRNSTLWPGSTSSFRRRVARFDAREYLTTTALDGGPPRSLAPAGAAGPLDVVDTGAQPR